MAGHAARAHSQKCSFGGVTLHSVVLGAPPILLQGNAELQQAAADADAIAKLATILRWAVMFGFLFLNSCTCSLGASDTLSKSTRAAGGGAPWPAQRAPHQQTAVPAGPPVASRDSERPPRLVEGALRCLATLCAEKEEHRRQLVECKVLPQVGAVWRGRQPGPVAWHGTRAPACRGLLHFVSDRACMLPLALLLRALCRHRPNPLFPRGHVCRSLPRFQMNGQARVRRPACVCAAYPAAPSCFGEAALRSTPPVCEHAHCRLGGHMPMAQPRRACFPAALVSVPYRRATPLPWPLPPAAQGAPGGGGVGGPAAGAVCRPRRGGGGPGGGHPGQHGGRLLGRQGAAAAARGRGALCRAGRLHAPHAAPARRVGAVQRGVHEHPRGGRARWHPLRLALLRFFCRRARCDRVVWLVCACSKKRRELLACRVCAHAAPVCGSRSLPPLFTRPLHFCSTLPRLCPPNWPCRSRQPLHSSCPGAAWRPCWRTRSRMCG